MKTSLEFKFGSLALATALGALQLQPGIAAESQPSALDLARQLNDAFVNVAADVSQSVVVIQVAYANDRSAINVEESPWFDSLPDSLKRYFAPDPEEETEPEEEPREPRFSGNGSGIILNQDGFILTNHHVVEDAAKIRVRLKDGREFEAVVQGTDELSEIAVIKLEGDLPNDLKPAMFANSDEIRVGEYAIAIGAPFALDYSVTVGHVSAVG